jgi:hypothetical protein
LVFDKATKDMRDFVAAEAGREKDRVVKEAAAAKQAEIERGKEKEETRVQEMRAREAKLRVRDKNKKSVVFVKTGACCLGRTFDSREDVGRRETVKTGRKTAN